MNAKTKSNTATITPIVKPEAKTADVRGAKERAETLQNLDTADDLMGTALLEGIRMTILYGRTGTDEVRKYYTRCGSPEVYASYFNRGFKVQQIVGEKLALDAVDKAAGVNVSGSTFPRVLAALKAIVDDATKSKGKNPKLNARDGAQAVKDAIAKASAPRDKKSAPRGVSTRQTITMAAAAMESGKGHREMATFLLLASQNAQRMAEPVGRGEAHRNALKKLADAAEAWQSFAK